MYALIQRLGYNNTWVELGEYSGFRFDESFEFGVFN